MKNDGGPAFPRPASTDEHNTPCNVYQDQCGMSLRDWFAAKALQNLPAVYDKGMKPEQLARDAYAIADAMLDERSGSRR